MSSRFPKPKFDATILPLVRVPSFCILSKSDNENDISPLNSLVISMSFLSTRDLPSLRKKCSSEFINVIIRYFFNDCLNDSSNFLSGSILIIGSTSILQNSLIRPYE
jgi:hypothetical protein